MLLQFPTVRLIKNYDNLPLGAPGSCINPFQEVGGPRRFSQKNSKIPRPTYLNKKRTFPETFCMGIQVNWIKGIHLTSSFFKDEYDRDKSFELFHYG